MIISASNRYVFVAVPKTGTHSVRQVLRPHLGPGDMEQVGLFIRKQFPIPALASLGHGHISLDQLRQHMDREKFDEFFKFAFVRNPFDRFVSYCSFMARNGTVFKEDPRRVMRHYIATPRHDHVLFQPQHSFVESSDGAMLADYIGRVETMQESFDFIASKVGIPTGELEQVNKTGRTSYRDYYDQELIDGVASLYTRDLELFGYEF